MSKRLAIAAAFAAIVALVAERPVDAAPQKGTTHCVAHVVGQKPTGELELGPIRCYASQTDAVAAEGVGEWGPGAGERAAATLSSFTLGTHCDAYNAGAPCFDVVGDSCSGGYINLSAPWNNAISSTTNGCSTIKHFNGFNLSGTSATTSGAGNHNLTSFNNLTSSIQYL